MSDDHVQDSEEFLVFPPGKVEPLGEDYVCMACGNTFRSTENRLIKSEGWIVCSTKCALHFVPKAVPGMTCPTCKRPMSVLVNGESPANHTSFCLPCHDQRLCSVWREVNVVVRKPEEKKHWTDYAIEWGIPAAIGLIIIGPSFLLVDVNWSKVHVPLGVWIGLGIVGYVGTIFLMAYILGRAGCKDNTGHRDNSLEVLAALLWPLTLAIAAIYGLFRVGAWFWKKGLRDGGYEE